MSVNIPDSTKLLMICPSRNRPDRIQEMLKSFDDTKSAGTELIIYIAYDDPRFEEYKQILLERNSTIGKRRSTPEVYNYISCELYPNIPYYGMTDDDHYYLTKGWDSMFIEAIERNGGYGLACGLDNLTDWNKFKHPCGCIIDGKIIRLLGYMVYPHFKHIGIDMAQGTLFGKLNKLHRLLNVTIEHRHIWNNKAQWDNNYKEIYTKENQEYGEKIYNEWKENELPYSLNLIREAIKKEAVNDRSKISIDGNADIWDNA